MGIKRFQLTSFKSWILQALFNGYERGKVDLYLDDKIAYDKGFRYFKGRFPNLRKSIEDNLSHCQGLSEISRKDGDLLKYSFYKFRQYELLTFEIFESNNEVVNKRDENDYNRVKILNYSKKTTWTAQSNTLKKCQIYKASKNIWDVKVKNLVNSISVKTKAGYESFNAGDIIGSTEDISKYYIYVKRAQVGDTIKVEKSKVDCSLVKVLVDKNGYIRFEKNFTSRHKLFLFQRAFYFDLKGNVRGSVQPCQLNAYYSMKHFRDRYCHNNFFSMDEIIIKPTPEDQMYLKDPELILTSDYFDRLIISFVQAYDDFLNQPHF